MDYLFVTTAGALAIRGAIAIALGIVALLLPGPTFFALTIAFGTFALVDGLAALITMFDRKTRLHRGWLAVEAVAGILAGILTLTRPGIAALSLVAIIGAWAIVTGVLKIVSAIRLRKQIQREWLLVLSGLASVALGGILVSSPMPGIIGVVWALGIFGLAYGCLLVALAIKMRRRADTLGQRMPRAA